MSLNSRNLTLIIVGAVLLFGVLIWPGMYRYERVVTSATIQVVRINRITGDSEIVHVTAR